ncbi:hypothetical protein GQ53DRAFT_338461 [Thozetella sp. PMI_491]|nr:hypothetical protein GQ53DRAFT_338461 [Thozetella sp. PMI_491]
MPLSILACRGERAYRITRSPERASAEAVARRPPIVGRAVQTLLAAIRGPVRSRSSYDSSAGEEASRVWSCCLPAGDRSSIWFSAPQVWEEPGREGSRAALGLGKHLQFYGTAAVGWQFTATAGRATPPPYSSLESRSFYRQWGEPWRLGCPSRSRCQIATSDGSLRAPPRPVSTFGLSPSIAPSGVTG